METLPKARTRGRRADARPPSAVKSPASAKSPAARPPSAAKHTHEEIEFIRAKPGPLVLYVEDEKFSLSPGEAVLIPPNLRHWTEPAGGAPSSVRFNPSLFAGKGYRRFIQPLMLNGKTCTLKLSGDAAPWQKDALRILDELDELTPNTESRELEFSGWIFILWNRIYLNHYAATPAFQNYRRLYKKMQGAVNYIHDHYQEEFTVDFLAEKANMSVGTFCRYFKQLLGVTSIRYRNQCRIRKSRELLVNTDSKISDIAFLCGYKQLSLFNREFQKMMGCTPSEYRKREVF